MSFANPSECLPKFSGMLGRMDIEITPALAQWVIGERERLGLSQAEIVALGGPSGPTQTKVESGTGSLSDASARKYEKALNLERGSIRSIANGSHQPLRLLPATDATREAAIQGLADAYRFADVAPGQVIDAVVKLLTLARQSPAGENRQMLLLAASTILSYMLRDSRTEEPTAEPDA